MALPTNVDFTAEISSIQTLINTQIAEMAAGAADVSYTLPTGVTVGRTGYLKYLLELRKLAIQNYNAWNPQMAVSRGR